jgi:hypothetical protein
MRLSLRVVNDELERLKVKARLAKGNGCFYFVGDEADEWIVRTVDLRNISKLTLEQWIDAEPANHEGSEAQQVVSAAGQAATVLNRRFHQNHDRPLR